jgi:hypothetical protein
LYWVARYTEIAFLKTNALAWHVLFLVGGIVSATLLFRTLRLAGIDHVPAMLASAWLLVAPGVSSVWIRLGPVESLGVLLLLVAAYSAARGAKCMASKAWDILFTTSLVAATLSKEPFALVPPALVGLRLFLRLRARGRAWPRTPAPPELVATLGPLAAGTIVVLLSFELAVASGDSYSGRILAAGGSPVATTLANLAILTWLGGAVAPLLMVGALVEAKRRSRLTPPLCDFLLGAGLVLLLVVPQLAVYRGGSGFAVGRYVLPAGLGMVVGIAAGTAWLRRQKYIALFVSVPTVLGVSLLLFVIATWREAELYRADSSVLAQAVDAIASSARRGATVGIAADPLMNYEFAVSFPYQLAWRGRADLDRRLLIAPDPNADQNEAAAIGAAVAGHFPGHADLGVRGCANLDAVVLLAPQDRVVDLMPCLASADFRLTSFSETVSIPSYLPQSWRGLFPPATVGYHVLLRASL